MRGTNASHQLLLPLTSIVYIAKAIPDENPRTNNTPMENTMATRSAKTTLATMMIATLCAGQLSGCASMFHGASQQVSVRSNVPGTNLYVNEAFVGKDSGVTTFKKNQNYNITARKEGCTDATVPASKSFDAITLLGVFIDLGLVSILLVDGAATGAWQQFDQTSFVIDPNCPKKT